MVHVWYVDYGDTAGVVDPMTLYQNVLAEIRKTDPDAYIEEIRQYQYQMAFYVNHPNWTTARTAKGLVLLDRKGLIDPITAIIIIAIAVAWIMTLGNVMIKCWTTWIKEMKTYPCPGDPNKAETEPCALHKDPATGKPLTFPGYSSLLSHMAATHPEALAYLEEHEATNWWEQIIDILPLILILIGAAIAIPLIVKLIPGKEGG